MYEQGYNREAKGSAATKQKLLQLWSQDVTRDVTPFIWLRAATRKGFSPSWPRRAGCPSESDKGHQPFVRSRRGERSWFLWCLSFLLPVTLFCSLWSHWDGSRVFPPFTEMFGPTCLMGTVPHINTLRQLIQHQRYHLRQLLTICYQPWVLSNTCFKSLKFQYSKLHRSLFIHL